MSGIQTCQYCQREFDRGTALVQHERYCRKNPTPFKPYPKTGHPASDTFNVVHLPITDPHYVEIYKRVWQYYGSRSHRETIEIILETIITEIEGDEQ